MADNNELIYTIRINTNDSLKSVKSIKDELKQVKTVLEQTATGGDDFKKLNSEFTRLNNELKNVGVAAGSLGTVKNEIKQITQQLATVKIDSPEYNSLIQKLGTARATLKDFKDEVRALDPDAKFKAFIGIATNIQAGFNVASGALKLFGVENENVAAAIQQTTAAMEVLQGLSALESFADNKNILAKVIGWKQTATATKEATIAQQANTVATNTGTVATKALGVAFKALGIGLIVSLLAGIVQNFDAIKKKVVELIPGIGNLGESFNKIKSIAVGAFDTIFTYFATLGKATLQLFTGDFTGLVDTFKNFGTNLSNAFEKGYSSSQGAQAKERNDKLIESQIDTNKRLLALKQANGEETFNLEKKILAQELSLLDAGSKEYLDKQNEIEVLIAQNKKENSEKAIKANEERIKKEAEAKKKAEADTEKLVKESAEADDSRKAQFEKELNERIELVNKFYDRQELLIKQNATNEEDANEELKAINLSRLNDLYNVNKQFYSNTSVEVLKSEKNLEDAKFAIKIENLKAIENAEKESLQLRLNAEKEFQNAKSAVEQQAFDAVNTLTLQLADANKNARLKTLEDEIKSQEEILKNQLDKGLITEGEYNAKKKQLFENSEKEKRKIAVQSAIVERTIKLAEIAFATAKDVGAIKTTAALAQAQATALLSNPVTAPYYPVAQAAVAATLAQIPLALTSGAIQSGLVLAAPLPKLAKGGVINAKDGKHLHDAAGTETSDSNLALLSKGESVINARSTKMFLPLLSKINEMGGGVKFRYASGGLNQFSSNATTTPQFNQTNTTLVDNSRVELLLEQLVNQKVKAYVVSSEMTYQQYDDATISGRASW